MSTESHGPDAAEPCMDATETAAAAAAERALRVWAPFGMVIPVLAGSSGAGSSVLAAALTDTLAAHGGTLLIDPADQTRSGLSMAASIEGSRAGPVVGGVRVRWSWRDTAVLGQLDVEPETEPNPLVAPPPLEPQAWLPPGAALHATVVDLGTSWSAPHPRPDPLAGPVGWLRVGPPGSDHRPCPVLVVRPTRPSLLAAEAALARFDPWLRCGELARPVQLVVMASWKARWPAGVAGAAGARLAPLVDEALFLPFDQDLERAGVTEAPIPGRVSAPLARWLRHRGLIHPTSHPATGRPHRLSPEKGER